jgi:uncharacterized membrane protein YuzA (DUF378 family)
MISDEFPGVQVVAVLLTAVGALNWGLVELLDLNLLTEVGLTGDLLGIAYLAVGVAGAVVLVDMLDLFSRVGSDAMPLGGWEN